MHGEHARYAFLRQHASLDKVPGGEPRGKTPREADGDEGPCQTPRYDGVLGQEDGSGHEVTERRAERRIEKQGQDKPGVAEAVVVEDRVKRDCTKATARLC